MLFIPKSLSKSIVAILTIVLYIFTLNTKYIQKFNDKEIIVAKVVFILR